MKKANTAGNALPLAPVIAVLLLGVNTIDTEAHAHELPSNFEMKVVKDEASGMKILDGDLDQAIDEISRSDIRPGERFFAENNLCVAYTLTARFDSAERACNDAIDAVKPAGERRSAQDPLRARYRAIALSNRGVLHAMTGDPRLARADFANAKKLRTGIRAPAVNLEYLAVRPARAEVRSSGP